MEASARMRPVHHMLISLIENANANTRKQIDAKSEIQTNTCKDSNAVAHVNKSYILPNAGRHFKYKS